MVKARIREIRSRRAFESEPRHIEAFPLFFAAQFSRKIALGYAAIRFNCSNRPSFIGCSNSAVERNV